MNTAPQPLERNDMKEFTNSITDIIHDDARSPIPIDIIPNNMGINLVSVESISWQEQDDGQLLWARINFVKP